ncbi:MAG: beta-carotene 15,15-monooxygenase [Mucilaginibacter sp.]|nr:beta-carotene 15,15-monooxygenase [Mucilaginibacter sp.]
MINIFRSFNPLNVVWLIIVLFLSRVGYLFHVPDKLEFIFVEPFARLLVPVAYEYALSPAVNVLLAAVLVFAQAVLLNYLINFYNLLGKPSFLPALMYVTLSGLFVPFLILSAPLICNFLLIWMLYKAFSLYKGEDAKSTVYDMGMIVALGSLIYFPFIYLILVIWIALVLFKPFNWREWVAGILGYATIFFFLAVFYYLNDRIKGFYNIWSPLGTKFPDHISINSYNYLLLIPVVLILVLCFFKLQQNFFKSYVQTRKSFQLLFFIFLIAAFSFYVNASFHLNHFLLCIAPAAVFFAYYFLYATRKWLYEGLFLLLLISIICFQFNKF